MNFSKVQKPGIKKKKRKVRIDITVDQDLVDILDSREVNKSGLINRLLKEELKP